MPSPDTCPKHHVYFMDVNWRGEKFRKPLCLSCHWERGGGALITRVDHIKDSSGFLHFIGERPPTVRHLQMLRAQVRRYLIKKKGLPRGAVMLDDDLSTLARSAGSGTADVISKVYRQASSIRPGRFGLESAGRAGSRSAAAKRLYDSDKHFEGDRERPLYLSVPDVAKAADWLAYHRWSDQDGRLVDDRPPPEIKAS
jgi:hypothetical protein